MTSFLCYCVYMIGIAYVMLSFVLFVVKHCLDLSSEMCYKNVLNLPKPKKGTLTLLSDTQTRYVWIKERVNHDALLTSLRRCTVFYEGPQVPVALCIFCSRSQRCRYEIKMRNLMLMAAAEAEAEAESSPVFVLTDRIIKFLTLTLNPTSRLRWADQCVNLPFRLPLTYILWWQ